VNGPFITAMEKSIILKLFKKNLGIGLKWSWTVKNKPKHTPGPLRVTRKGTGTGLNYTSFAIYPVTSNTPIDITAENAALLASAPELLNILDDALAALHHENECIIMMGKEPRYIELVTKGLQVIKKAKGEE
jgi:hypothetical protein